MVGDVRGTPAYCAVQNDNGDALEMLISHGADVNAIHADGSVLIHTAIRKHFEAELELNNRDCWQRIMDSQRKTGKILPHGRHPPGTHPLVILLDDSNSKLDLELSQDGFTPVLEASVYGNLYALRRLVAKGAKLDVQTPEFPRAAVYQANPMVYSANPMVIYVPHPVVLGRVSRPIHVPGSTALHLLVAKSFKRKDFLDVFEELLRAGADTDIVKDAHGNTVRTLLHQIVKQVENIDTRYMDWPVNRFAAAPDAQTIDAPIGPLNVRVPFREMDNMKQILGSALAILAAVDDAKAIHRYFNYEYYTESSSTSTPPQSPLQKVAACAPRDLKKGFMTLAMHSKACSRLQIVPQAPTILRAFGNQDILMKIVSHIPWTSFYDQMAAERKQSSSRPCWRMLSFPRKVMSPARRHYDQPSYPGTMLIGLSGES